MSVLEMRYRRLLRAYPADHRATYEREMLGVLIEGSRPGQRFPRPGDAFDLVRAGLVTRLGGLRSTERGTGWRNAAALVGLLTVAGLAAVALRRLALGVHVLLAGEDRLQAYGVDGLILLDVAVRSVAWLVVVVAMLAGLRRTAFALAGAAALIEIGAMLSWPPRADWHDALLTWRLLPVLLAVALLGAATRARPVGRPWWLVGAVVVGTVIGLPNGIAPYWLAGTLIASEDLFWQVPSLGLLAAGALLWAGLRRVEPSLRRRVLVLLSPAAFLLLANATPWLADSPDLGQMLLTAAATAVAAGAAVALLRRRERAVREPGAAR